MENLITYLTFGAVIAIFAIQLVNRSRGETITIEGITDAITVAGDIWEEAQEWVTAAEQLWESGKLPKDGRFDYVLSHLKERYPDVDTEMVRAAIEAGVWNLKRLQWRD